MLHHVGNDDRCRSTDTHSLECQLGAGYTNDHPDKTTHTVNKHCPALLSRLFNPFTRSSDERAERVIPIVSDIRQVEHLDCPLSRFVAESVGTNEAVHWIMIRLRGEEGFADRHDVCYAHGFEHTGVAGVFTCSVSCGRQDQIK